MNILFFIILVTIPIIFYFIANINNCLGLGYLAIFLSFIVMILYMVVNRMRAKYIIYGIGMLTVSFIIFAILELSGILRSILRYFFPL